MKTLSAFLVFTFLLAGLNTFADCLPVPLEKQVNLVKMVQDDVKTTGFVEYVVTTKRPRQHIADDILTALRGGQQKPGNGFSITLNTVIGQVVIDNKTEADYMPLSRREPAKIYFQPIAEQDAMGMSRVLFALKNAKDPYTPSIDYLYRLYKCN